MMLEIRVKELTAQIKEYNKMPHHSRNYYVCSPMKLNTFAITMQFTNDQFI